VWDVNEQIQALVSAARPIDPSRLADPRGTLASLLAQSVAIYLA